MPVFVVVRFDSFPLIFNKGTLYLKESVSCVIKHLSVYHAYLDTI